MSKIIHFKGFEPKQNHSYLIDNSVLLFLFAPIGNYNSAKQSSIGKFFDQCKVVGAGINTTSLVLSEFCNKVLKDFFDDYKANHSEQRKENIKLKEHYRKDPQYKEDILVINSAVKSILKICDRYPDDFNHIDIDGVLNNTFTADFNDSYFIELANRKDWIIVTRDNDIIRNTKLKNDVISFLDNL